MSNNFNKTLEILTEGKAQDMILDFLKTHKGTDQLSNIHSDMNLRKKYGIIHFSKLQTGALALAKRNKIKFDGISKISLIS